MSDYKELIARLRDLKKATVGGWEIQSLQTEMRMDALDAADAIEQLVKERDKLLQDLAKVCDEAEAEVERLEEELADAKLERDAYAKVFKISRTKDIFANRYVIALEHNEILETASVDDVAIAIAYRLASKVKAGVQE